MTPHEFITRWQNTSRKERSAAQAHFSSRLFPVGGKIEEPDFSLARPLPENPKIAFVGGQKDGPFDVPASFARELLSVPLRERTH